MKSLQKGGFSRVDTAASRSKIVDSPKTLPELLPAQGRKKGRTRTGGVPTCKKHLDLRSVTRAPRKARLIEAARSGETLLQLRITKRGTALVATAACLLLLADGCGSASAVRSQGKAGQLVGRVSICPPIGRRACSRTKATVTILGVHGKTLGRSVAKVYAANGDFRFSLPPGKYFPSASPVHAGNGIRCIAGQMVVTSAHIVRDDVECYPRVRRSA